MADEVFNRDPNHITVAGAVTDDVAEETRMWRIDDATKGLLVSVVGGTGAGTVTSISAGTGITLTPNPIVSIGTVSLADTAVTPGAYTSANITVDQQGRITAIANGSGSGTVTSVNSANTDATVATTTTTPVITIVQAPALRSATTTVNVSSATAPTLGQVLTATDSTHATWQTPGAGSGDVVGPASATDNAVARYNLTTGKLIQNSGVTIGDSNDTVITIANTANVKGLTIYPNDTTNHPLALQVGPDSAKVTATTVVQYNDDTAGFYSDWAFNCSGDGFPTINFQSTGGTVAAPTASDSSIAGSINGYGYNASNVQKLFATMAFNIDSTVAGAEEGGFRFSSMKAGVSTGTAELTSVKFRPSANDGLALGDSTHNFSDLFLASGAVINFANGDVVMTHSSGILTMGAGEMRITTVGTNTASVVTVGGTQTLTAKTLTSPNINEAVALTSTSTKLNLLTSAGGTTGTTSTNIVFSTSPTLVTPVLGAATATSINGLVITTTTGTLTITNAKTLAVTNTLTLSGTDSTTMTFPTTTATLARTDAAQTFTGAQTFSNAVINTNNAIAASSNAATVPITAKLNTVTNSSAATLTITMTTTSATDGQMTIVRVLDFSAAAQTITWVNTENSTVTAPTTSNGSTTLPLTVGFMYNSGTSKWRCVASA